MLYPPRLLPLLLLLPAVLPPATLADEKPDKPGGKANRLAHETSPYLLQHAHNPVDWFPWGPGAFEKAKKENKLVFLSIGYSSCHWCHVMEKESFANEEVAKILNQHFICIKVDREERPDIDNIYMTALTEVLNRRGGWPLSMFLMPDGKPIEGGTYWPREDREIEGQKVGGFKTLLTTLHKIYTEKPKAIQEQADRLASATTDHLARTARTLPLLDLDRDLVTAAVEEIKESHDSTHGGFGNPLRKFEGAKFPMPSYLMLLFNEGNRSKNKQLKEMVFFCLDRMAMGGIYDHLGGGFHRYSTERTWTVPHFEKMLYDNAQLCELYALAFAETKKPLYQRVLRQTLGFIAREMTSPEGAFYSALDADSEGEEGKFYIWTPKEVDTVLAGQTGLGLFKKVYGLSEPANFESRYHILCLKKSLADRAKELKRSEEELDQQLSPLRQKLFEVRAKRPRPFLDTKVLTAWNGQMIAAAALAGQALGDPKAIAAAGKAADFILKNLKTQDGRLLRTYGSAPGQKAEARLNGYLDDYAYLVHGLLTLHDVTGEGRFLDEARTLTETMVKLHQDADRGGFYFTSNDHEKLFARSKDQHDGAQPAGNSMAARNLVRLWIKTRDDRYRKLAETTIKSLSGPLKSNPSSLAALADALGLYLEAKKN